MLSGGTELKIQTPVVTDDHYCRDVSLLHVCLFIGAAGPEFVFMDDTTTPHHTAASAKLLEKSEDIRRMDWPAYSLDLNTIEHVRDVLRRRFAARQRPPANAQKLKKVLMHE